MFAYGKAYPNSILSNNAFFIKDISISEDLEKALSGYLIYSLTWIFDCSS